MTTFYTSETRSDRLSQPHQTDSEEKHTKHFDILVSFSMHKYDIRTDKHIHTNTQKNTNTDTNTYTQTNSNPHTTHSYLQDHQGPRVHLSHRPNSIVRVWLWIEAVGLFFLSLHWREHPTVLRLGEVLQHGPSGERERSDN